MELQNPNNGGRTDFNEKQCGNRDTEDFINEGRSDLQEQNQCCNSTFEEIDSTCSTPYVSAPSSPGRPPNHGYYFSAPASPMHFILASSSSLDLSGAGISGSRSSEFEFNSRFNGTGSSSSSISGSGPGSCEFEFSARFSTAGAHSGSTQMISADELFLNGQIRPMKLSSHLQRPQILAPLMDLEVDDEEDNENKDLNSEDSQGGDLGFQNQGELVRGRDVRLRNRSLSRRTRSMSPLRNPGLQWQEEFESSSNDLFKDGNEPDLDLEQKQTETLSTAATPSVSASSSRSSSGRSSRWISLKDFLYRSKSEGRGYSKEKFWSSISFSPSKEKKPSATELQKPKKGGAAAGKPGNVAGKHTNSAGKRRVPLSPHALHYTANRAQAEEMRKKTFLPYRQGLFGCLGFGSKSYTAMSGFARTLHPVSSR